jgi:hypothetical protein
MGPWLAAFGDTPRQRFRLKVHCARMSSSPEAVNEFGERFTETDIRQAAGCIFGEYDDLARLYAIQIDDECLEVNDLEGSLVWMRVLTVIKEFFKTLNHPEPCTRARLTALERLYAFKPYRVVTPLQTLTRVVPIVVGPVYLW